MVSKLVASTISMHIAQILLWSPTNVEHPFTNSQFFPHAITIWNRLVSHKDFTLVDCTSISSFKSHLYSHLVDML